MRKLFRTGTWYYLSIIGYVLISSCGDPNSTGGDILPPNDIIGATYVDTLSSEMNPIVIDTARTSNIGQVMFGKYKDAEFGTLSADAYIQFMISGTSINFGDPTKLGLDSLILSIDMTGCYGRYDQPQTIEVHEIDFPGLSRDSTYFSNRELPVKATDLANQYNMDFSPYAGYFDLRIPLDSTLGNKLLFAPTETLNNGSIFRSYFNGIRIRSGGYQGDSRENGAVFYLDAAPGAKTKLTMYYHEDTVHTSYDFKIADSCSKFTHFVRSDTQSTLLGYSLNDPSGLGQEYGFIQDGSLIKTFLRFPGLDNLPNCIIHQAFLTLHVEPGFTGSLNRLEPPTEIYAYLSDSTGKTEDRDFATAASPYNNTTKTYNFNLTELVMKIVNGKKANNGFLLVPALGGVIGRTMSRAVFAGPADPVLKPVLKIVYSSLPGQ